ncbi:hypothetical protein HNY73_010686 [Argiope bruennichi]|uniref:Uncharacterized protein n=1 Tax=Argiope bruennichi TaxID=94029 RepID=A0A8T0F6P9_ARGBR|nr:hypothetical protein HNY73_010686 [Argiope bruennichi]
MEEDSRDDAQRSRCITQPLAPPRFFIGYCQIVQIISRAAIGVVVVSLSMKMLREFGQRLKLVCRSINSKQLLDLFIAEYTDIHKLACDIESSLSLQVLAICASNFTELFVVFATALGFYQTGNNAYVIEKLFISPLNFLSLFGIAYFASEVQLEDQRVRRVLKEVVYRSSLSKETWKWGEILKRVYQSKKIFSNPLGMFYFGRGFLLASIGAIVSYNLLLLQLQ